MECSEKLSHFHTLNEGTLAKQQKSCRESYDMAGEIKRLLLEKSLEILHINHILKNIPQISADFHMKTVIQVQRIESILHDSQPQSARSNQEDQEPQSSEKETWFRKNVTVCQRQEVVREEKWEEEEVKAPQEWSVKKRPLKDDTHYGPFQMAGAKCTQQD